MAHRTLSDRRRARRVTVPTSSAASPRGLTYWLSFSLDGRFWAFSTISLASS